MKKKTRIELTEERVREIVMEEIAKEDERQAVLARKHLSGMRALSEEINTEAPK